MLKLPVFILFECFDQLNTKAFEKDLPTIHKHYFTKIAMTELEKIIEKIKSDLAENITEIDLSYQQIGNKGAVALSKALKEANLPHLEWINLVKNQIGDKGAKAFAEALKEANLPHLKEVNFRSNQIKNEGANALASALKGANLPYLKEFNLFFNQIKNTGAMAFAEDLIGANLPHLKAIDLSRNPIGDADAKAIALVLETYISDNKKYLAEAAEKVKKNYLKYCYFIASPIEQALIDIEYAKLLQEEGKLKVAIDLFGAALHGFRHSAEAAPKFLGVKQIVKQTTEGMKIAIKKHKAAVGKLKLPVFVLIECFEHLNARAFEKDLLKLLADLGIKNIWEPNLVDVILNMVPSRDAPDFSFDLLRKLTATDGEDNNDTISSKLIGDTGTASQTNG